MAARKKNPIALDSKHKAKRRAWIGAIAVHLLLIGGLVFNLRWKQQTSPPVSVALVAPLPKSITSPSPTPPPKPPPTAKPPPAPKPTPVPPPPPAPNPADIAREKAKETKRQQDAVKAEQARKEKLVKEQAEKLAREKQIAADKENANKLAEQRARELKSSQDRALKEQRTAQATREANEKAAREATERAATQQAAERAEKATRDAATAQAAAQAEANYANKISTKVLNNIVADTPSGNPEAIFEVRQLPTGEVVTARLIRSSGNRIWDEAAERAILKSSPLPLPDKKELFQRTLTLKLRPRE